MEVKQIYDLMNTITDEILGKDADGNAQILVQEDLSNITDVGTAIFNATDVDNYCKKLLDRIGKVIFVNRPYSGNIPSVLMDSWEFGSVMEKITADLPDATANESWELTDGASYDPNIFYKPTVSAKFYNKRVTFEVPVSITEKQVKESFTNASQLNGFISMIYNAVDKSMTVKIDSLVMRTINSMIGETIKADYGTDQLASKSGIKAVNLLYLYNQKFSKSLTASNALTDADFIKFASYEMGMYQARLTKLSRLFNIEGKDRFTPSDLLHVVMLADFRKACAVYLQSNVYHDSLVALPNAEEVPYWQGSGASYAFSDVSKINIVTPSGDAVEAGGILGVMFDRDALGVCCQDRRVTTNYNPKAEFTNSWFKFDCGTFADKAEQFVVFFVA